MKWEGCTGCKGCKGCKGCTGLQGMQGVQEKSKGKCLGGDKGGESGAWKQPQPMKCETHKGIS